MTNLETDPRATLQRRVDHDLTLHPPAHAYTADGMDSVRTAAKVFAAECIDKGCCPSRELSLALTKIEEALFYAIASIARYQGQG